MPLASATLILSDTHLGKTHGGARSAAMLRPLLEGVDRLIINGDVAEGVYPHLREEAARQVEALGTLCDELGVKLTLLAGNHDPLISPLRSLDLADGQVHLTHGDHIHPGISPWAGRRRHQRELDWRRVREHAEAENVWQEYAGHEHPYAAGVMLHASFDEQVAPPVYPRGPRRAWDIAHQAIWAAYYWQVMPRYAMKHAARVSPNARFFIFGHIHRAGIWRDKQRTFINTGSFGIPGRPRGVVLAEGKLTARKIAARRGAWRWNGPAIAEFALTHSNQAQVATASHPAAESGDHASA